MGDGKSDRPFFERLCALPLGESRIERRPVELNIKPLRGWNVPASTALGTINGALNRVWESFCAHSYL